MIRKSTNDLTIKPKMSRNTLMLSLVIGVLSVLALVYFVYGQGLRSGHDRYEQDQAMITQLKENMTSLREQLSVSQEGLVFSKRQQQIQAEAYKQMNKAYANSEQKNSVLGSRLDFYRSIISPEDGQSGPAIQQLNYSYDDGKLSFDITLVQAIKHKHQVRGSLKVTLFENDVATAEWPRSSDRSVNYQYFSQVSGSIDKAVITEKAKVKVELHLQDGSMLERWFNVPSIAASNNSNDKTTSG
ncbi:MAG: hypothetical protein JKX81_01720 [Arenicella sp.]|nr:hypothetical protein [Arenicella sp.]